MTVAVLIRILIISVVIGFFLLLQTKINFKRQYRGRQAIFPLLAAIIAVGVIVVLMRNFDRISFIVNQFTVPYISITLIFAINLLIMVGFLLVKIILYPIVNALWEKNWLMGITSSAFYEFDEDYSSWFLKSKWVNFRTVFKVLVICLALICIAYIFATIENFGDINWVMYFPCAVLVVCTEIWNFINGVTKEEFKHSFIGDEADFRRISQYYRIREIYEKMFAPQILMAHTGSEFTRRPGTSEIIKELTESKSPIDKIVANYFSLSDTEIFPDSDYVHATTRLMHRKSVLFFNPFYKDFGLYITLPIINALLCGKRCLVVVGRSSSCDDIKHWLTDMIKDYSRMESLWRVSELSTAEAKCEIGILSLMQLYDLDVLKANRNFFAETDFVLLIEPSIIINTGQVGLGMITDEMRKREDAEKPVFCICDRKTEGLVDTLSHLLYTEIADVMAMPVPRCMYAGMTWNADGDYIRQQLFDKQTRYLGNGIELSAVAIKNQIPKITWYSETKSPVRDIRNITGQYYPTICRYMNIPSQQNSINERIDFVSNIWSAPKSVESFVIAEDEFCNMFSMLRAYLSRGRDQIFINILSENYLLRDYMRYNKEMFTSDPHAIPSIVPDYAKTERNATIKLLLYMAFRPVTETEIIDELSYAGISTTDAIGTLTLLLQKHTFVDEAIFSMHRAGSGDGFTVSDVNSFSVAADAFDKHFADSLKNAYYVVEEEERDAEYIDGKLFGHVTQKLLPGQFITYDGKYYIAKMVSPTNGVILRRAYDLYDGRKYYRQVRTYELHATEEIIRVRKVIDVETAFIRCNFSVTTTGYLEMQDNGDLRTARLIDFANDPATEKYRRNYKNKSVMRLLLPDTDDNIRFTICMLLSEAFRSIFPNAWHYIAVVSKRPDDIEGMTNYLVYEFDTASDDEYIYIIEDSDMDLGLLEAIDRNLDKLMEILTDYIDWHFEKMREPEHEDPILGKKREIMTEEEKRLSLFARMADRIRKLFGMQKEDPAPVVEKPPEVEEKTEEAEEPPSPLSTGESENASYSLGDNPEDKKTDSNSEITEPYFTDEITADDNEWPEASFKEAGIVPIGKTRYQQECYLKFGFEKIDRRIRLVDVRNYLQTRGCGNSSLTLARKRDILAKKPLDVESSISCDFCGQPLTGVSYEKITDGRLRCNSCSLNAITSVEEFRELFYKVMGMMEGQFNISFKVPINIKMTDARTIAKGAGSVYKPTQASIRVLGYAQKKGGNYSLFFENGSPYLAAIDLIVHEMTHIWQFVNWDSAQIKEMYKADTEAVYEGMAMWAAIQHLYQIGETYYAELQESIAEKRDDAYGKGLRAFRERYPFVKDSSMLKFSPFSTFPPL